MKGGGKRSGRSYKVNMCTPTSLHNFAHGLVKLALLYSGGGSSSEDSKLDQIQHRLAA